MSSTQLVVLKLIQRHRELSTGNKVGKLKEKLIGETHFQGFFFSPLMWSLLRNQTDQISVILEPVISGRVVEFKLFILVHFRN